MCEIVERNKAAQGVATKLRRELQELIDEAIKLGVLDVDEEEDDADEEKGGMVKGDLIASFESKSHPLET